MNEVAAKDSQQSQRPDYRAIIKSAVDTPFNDKWAERIERNTGVEVSAELFAVDESFADRYAKHMNDNYDEESIRGF